MRAGDGVGIRETLKMSWSKDLEGSSPSRPTREASSILEAFLYRNDGLKCGFNMPSKQG